MCELCPATCVECGIVICFDIEQRRDDFIAPAYETNCGNILCNQCGLIEDKEETYEEQEYDWREEMPE